MCNISLYIYIYIYMYIFFFSHKFVYLTLIVPLIIYYEPNGIIYML
ncbi:hypothetical protein ACMBCN_03410 [Candidatus Liberibacter asiaticus]|nr:hypothetical protein [Candidatus Liberibacter asiaticus]